MSSPRRRSGRRHTRPCAIEFSGRLSPAVDAKDLVLALIGRISAGGAIGHFVEFAGSCVARLSMAQRMTICNMAVEAGARAAIVAPDQTTFAYLKGRPLRAGWRGLGQGGRRMVGAAERSGRGFRPRGGNPRRRNRADRDVGHQPAGRGGRRRRRARPQRGDEPAGEGARRSGNCLHGAGAWHPHHRHRHRPGVHRLLHQRTHRGPSRRGRDRAPGQGGRPCDRRARLQRREAAGGE